MHTALEEEEITEQLKELSEWYYENGKLVKSFTFLIISAKRCLF